MASASPRLSCRSFSCHGLGMKRNTWASLMALMAVSNSVEAVSIMRTVLGATSLSACRKATPLICGMW
ncbi:hypothetical protein D3C86_2020290 [compost metagenome]